MSRNIFYRVLSAILAFAVIYFYGNWRFDEGFFQYPAQIIFLATLGVSAVVIALMTIFKYKLESRTRMFNVMVLSSVLFLPFSEFPKWYIIIAFYCVYALCAFAYIKLKSRKK